MGLNPRRSSLGLVSVLVCLVIATFMILPTGTLFHGASTNDGSTTINSMANIAGVSKIYPGTTSQMSASQNSVSQNGQGSQWLPQTPQGWPLVVSEQNTSQFTVTSGVSHFTQTFQTVQGPERSNVLSINTSNSNVEITPVLSNNSLVSGDSTLTAMSNNSSEVGGIDGGYFLIHGTGAPMDMLLVNGTLRESPVADCIDCNNGVFGVFKNGTAAIVHEDFSGNVTDMNDSSNFGLSSINILSNGLVMFTPAYGGALTVKGHSVAYLQGVAGQPHAYVVTSVLTDATTVPPLTSGAVLIGQSVASNSWISDNLQKGNIVNIGWKLSPFNNFYQAVGGQAIVVRNGRIVPTPSTPLTNTARTAVGISKNGKHVFFVVFDGIQPALSLGVTYPEVAAYLIQLGAYNAMMFDGGGSSEMVARIPGNTNVSVMNSPSDGSQRPVAVGIFVRTTELFPGSATSVVVNGNKPLTVLDGTTIPVSAYSLDSLGNPSSSSVSLSVSPSRLATISGNELTAAGFSGHGRLIATTSNGIVESVPITVVNRLASVIVTPSEANLSADQSLQLHALGISLNGGSVILPNGSVDWAVNNASLGTVTATGIFTSGSGVGLVNVTAEAGSATGSASVAVGQIVQVVDTMTDVSNWSTFLTEGTTGNIGLNTTVKRVPSSAGSMEINYSIPAGTGVKQFVFFPIPNVYMPPPGTVKKPTSVGIWIKGDGSGLWFAEGYAQSNVQLAVFYPTYITFNGWRLIIANLSPALQFPLNTYFLDFLIINPAKTLTGHLFVSDLSALYSPRPLVVPPYVPIPQNPKWLQFTESPSSFSNNGFTFLSIDDAHLVASNPNSTGDVALHAIFSQMKQLPQQAVPSFIMTQGDMVNSGTLANLRFLSSVMNSSGIPYHLTVGNHEISQGANPENRFFAKIFGPTHYTFTYGNAEFIVLDNSHGGLLSSDRYQVPNQEQYNWLVSVLSLDTANVTFVVAHMPPFDPHLVKNSQMLNRYEAHQFERLMIRFQSTHPGTHVVLLFGHARGFAENLLNGAGQNVANGMPNFVVADVGVPAYAPVNQGGFYNYVLFHVTQNGNVQFAVVPILASIAINTPNGSTVKVGQTLNLTATGTTPTGFGISNTTPMPPLEVPIQDPASHFWTVSNPGVAQINMVTGVLTALSPGTVTVTVTSDGLSASITVHVVSAKLSHIQDYSATRVAAIALTGQSSANDSTTLIAGGNDHG